ncbi:MAG TPA: TetR/AcrR family transcriptional regulator [Thermoleophilaceae bacterium]|nr:TetR/AcrR family transcriptional regulator [Thermoleophilaceae bacterium]
MPPDVAPPSSARRDEILELAYRYVLDQGIGSMSLRPLAAAVGSSPRVLLFLFGSKEELVRALLARARAEELELLEQLALTNGRRDLPAIAEAVWDWLAAPEHRALLRLWAEGYGRSLVERDGPWSGFAIATVEDWLDVLAAAQPARVRNTAAGVAERTLTLAVLRGALLDLLATDDRERTTAAVHRHVARMRRVRG